jgi:hypothetical protein
MAPMRKSRGGGRKRDTIHFFSPDWAAFACCSDSIVFNRSYSSTAITTTTARPRFSIIRETSLTLSDHSHSIVQTVSNHMILLSSLSARPRNTDIDHVKILRY